MGVGVGRGVAVGMGVAVGLGVGVGVTLDTLTIPTILQHAQCGLQKYGKFPTILKVCVKTSPWARIPESQIPLGIPGLPEVVLWPLELKVQRTVSPG